jgi:hypothetical protein
MSWRKKNCIRRDTWSIYTNRSPHDQALGKKEVQVTASFVSKHAYHHQTTAPHWDSFWPSPWPFPAMFRPLGEGKRHLHHC